MLNYKGKYFTYLNNKAWFFCLKKLSDLTDIGFSFEKYLSEILRYWAFKHIYIYIFNIFIYMYITYIYIYIYIFCFILPLAFKILQAWWHITKPIISKTIFISYMFPTGLHNSTLERAAHKHQRSIYIYIYIKFTDLKIWQEWTTTNKHKQD